MIISNLFSQGSIGSPGIVGLPGQAGQVVRVQKILINSSVMEHDTRNETILTGWHTIPREKKEVWDLLGHQVIQENVYV